MPSLRELIAELPESSPEIPEVSPDIRADIVRADNVRVDTQADRSLLETRLPDEWHKAYSFRLQGMPVGEIAKKFDIVRETVWRWCKSVEQEYCNFLERTPQFNQVALQLKKLSDLETENRKSAAVAKSERAKAMFLANAMKAVQSQNELLLDTGVFERQAEKLFKVVTNLKPVDIAQLEMKQQSRSREEIVSALVQALSKSAIL